MNRSLNNHVCYSVRYLWGGLATVFVLLATVASTGRLRESPVRIPLTPRSDLRVLKVSLGTNHVFSREATWRQVLRPILPDSLEKFLGFAPEWRASTRHSSLVVWLDECDAAGKWHANGFDAPLALLENGVVAAGRTAELPTRVIRVEFPSFARDRKHVPLQVRYGTNVVRFTVRNPQPVSRTVAKGAPLPQTNAVKGTQVMLASMRTHGHGSGLEHQVLIRTKANPPTRWFSWRVTTFDDLGNWGGGAFQHSASVRVPALPRTNSVLRFAVEGVEYISAGFVAPPTAGSAVVLQPHPRAGTYGAQTVICVGPGEYTVTNGITTGKPPVRALGKEMEFQGFVTKQGKGTNWGFGFATPVPAVLCVSELDFHEAIPRVRVRERLPGNGGRIFASLRSTSITNSTRRRMRVATLSALPAAFNPTNLEVEIIGTLPPVQFLVSPR